MSIHHTTPYHHRKRAEKAARETAEWEAAGNTITQVKPGATGHKKLAPKERERAWASGLPNCTVE